MLFRSPATPRNPGIAADNLNHKHPNYPKKLDIAMKQRYVEVPMSAFDNLLPGKSLTIRQFEKINEFKDYDVKGAENDMYPGLVSCGVDELLLPDVLNYRSVGCSMLLWVSRAHAWSSRTSHTGWRMETLIIGQT